MTLKHLLAAASAAALLGGAAYAQDVGSTPAADMTAPSGDQSTTMPSGVVNPMPDTAADAGADASATTSAPDDGPMDSMEAPSQADTSAMPPAGQTGDTTTSPTIDSTLGASSTMDSSAGTGLTAPSAAQAGAEASAVVQPRVTANAPIPDTPENREKYGEPLSNAGKRSEANGR